MATTEVKAGKPIILIDNNVIQLFLGRETAPLLEPILQEAIEIGAELAVSNIVLFEALKAIIFNSAKFKPVAEFIDNTLVRYEVNDNVLISAAKIHELYGGDENVRTYKNSISTEDIIIGTTAMMLGAYILTADCNDFPRPFFSEVNKQMISYNRGNRAQHTVLYVLQPDSELITKRLDAMASH